MTRPARIGRAVAATAMVLLLGAPVAAARPAIPATSASMPLGTQLRELVDARAGAGHQAIPFQSVVSLGSRGGYHVQVAGVGSSVAIEVFGPHGRSLSAYLAKGTVTPNRLEASFGSRGRVSMRFHLSRNRTWVKPHRRCKGAGRFVVRRGTFSGAVRFDGEGGYLSLDAHRAKGKVTSIARKCVFGNRGSPRRRTAAGARDSAADLQVGELVASWRQAVAAESFLALDDGVKARFEVVVERSEGQLAILRLARAIGSPDGLSFDSALTRARVAPPAPFSGVGTYAAAPDGTIAWTGPLAVDFPGAKNSPLTGPPFEVMLGTGFPPGD